MTQFLNGTDPSLRLTRAATVDTFTAGVGFTAGSSTSISLSNDPGSENNVIISFDGIVQHRTEYSVSGTTVTFTAAIPAAVAAIEATYTTTVPANEPADNSVTNAKMADDAVGLAELSATGTPSSSTFLRGDNAWAEAGGGAWTFLSATTFSNSNHYTFNAFNASAYDAYVFVLINVVPVNDAVHIHMITSSDGGSNFDEGASDYNWIMARNKDMVSDSGDGGDTDPDDSHIALIGDNSGGSVVVGSDANEAGVSGQIWLFDPASTSITHGTFDLCYQSNTPENLLNISKGGFARMSAADVDAIKIEFSGSSNIESGQINAYGIKNA